MTVGLGDRVSMTATARDAFLIRVYDLFISVEMMTIEPPEQRGAEVEADVFVVVGIRRVALGVNAFVPVVIGSGTRLGLYFARPGILTGRLVKVSMNHQKTHMTGLTEFSRLTKSTRIARRA